MSFLYRCLTLLYAIPLAVVILVRSLFGHRKDLERLGLRLTRRDSSRPLLWLVASSVGEVGVAVALCTALKRMASIEIALTVTTATGRKQAEQAGAVFDHLHFHPLDLASATRRFLDKLKPAALVMIETELWPTLLRQALKREVKLVQVAGRLSEKSFSRYQALRPALEPLLGRYSAILCQSRTDADRFERLGAPSERTAVIGSPKEKYQPPVAENLDAVREYLAAWSADTVFVAGSTRPGEELITLTAFSTALQTLPNLKLVLAPRHLNRIPEVTALLNSTGLRWQRRSEGACGAQHQVLLLDTIGELNLIYHLADLAFVGGTLAPLGGHNLLEPALAGIPVLYGPHVFNQQPGAEALQRYNLGRRVADADQLAAALHEFLCDGSPRARVATQVEDLRAASANVIDEYVQRILEVVKL